MYLASLKKKYWASAMLGALATLSRQTNVVWLVFVAADGAIRFAEEFHPDDCAKCGHNNSKLKEDDAIADNKSTSNAPTLRRRLGSSKSTSNLSNYDTIRSPCHASGAKEAHVVSPYFAQMMYFALVSASALAPMHFSFGQVVLLCQLFWKNKICSSFLLLMALFVGFFAVHLFSIAHPYLLADNRQYPFYIWRKVIQAHWTVKYLLVPVYVYSWTSIITTLGRSQNNISVMLFITTTALVLIPTPLIEFRYYTIPFFFFVIHSQCDDNMKLLLTGILYVAIDIFTLMMFLFRPFHWAHEPEPRDLYGSSYRRVFLFQESWPSESCGALY